MVVVGEGSSSRSGGYAPLWDLDYDSIPPPFDNPIENAKAWLADGHVLSVAVEMKHFSFPGTWGNPPAAYWDPILASNTNHQVALVGYDDEINPSGAGPDHRGGFLMVNSFGPEWNGFMKGFLWISYDYARRYMSSCWIQNPGTPDRPLITGISSRTANVGDSVTVTGQNFGSHRRAAKITFGGVPATDVCFTNEAVTATVPVGASSPVVVSDWEGKPSNQVEFQVADVPPSRLVPIVLDVTSGASHFTTELTLTNRGARPVTARLVYQASIGAPAGPGEATEPLGAGEQKVIPDALAFLRTKGLPIPAGDQGGELLVRFEGAESEHVVAASARTTTPPAAPQPAARVGVGYPALPPSQLTGIAPLTVFGLRSDAAYRSSIAVFNPSDSPVALRVTAFESGIEGASKVIRDRELVPPHGWIQYSGILGGPGYASGWVTVEPLDPGGPFGAYGIVTDNASGSAAFIPPVSPCDCGDSMTVPVLVETANRRSDLSLTNRSGGNVYVTLHYREALQPEQGPGGELKINLLPQRELLLQDAIEELRKRGLRSSLGPKGAADYAGSLEVIVNSVPLSTVFAGARTVTVSPAGGRFGVFTPAIVQGQAATTEAFLNGLRADESTRTNVAIVNTGDGPDGNVTLELAAFDGDAQGAERGREQVETLGPGEWRQLSGFLAERGVRNGWVRITRVEGTAPWIAYAVVNDGARPGEGTGDGLYVPMERVTR